MGLNLFPSIILCFRQLEWGTELLQSKGLISEITLSQTNAAPILPTASKGIHACNRVEGGGAAIIGYWR
jgi:hypothetical protein